MDKAFLSGALSTPPAAPGSPSIGYPTGGDPTANTPATNPGAYWFHMITMEILNAITAAGITPDQSNLTQLTAAIRQLSGTTGDVKGTTDTNMAHHPGWVKSGTTVSRTGATAALFALYGTTYGAGDGSTTFTLPDLRGEFLRGLDDGRGVDTGRGILTSQSSTNLAHTHGFSDNFGRAIADGNVANSGGGLVNYGGAAMPGTTDSSGDTTEARPRNVAVLWLIKM